jgi:hypothetical protein
VLWSLASGAAWTLAIVSNILYIGLLVLAAYCAVHQVLKIRQFAGTVTRVIAAVGSWNLLIPVIFFATVAYPATTASQAYAKNGLRFIHQNLHYYRQTLAPTGALAAVYITMLVLGVAGGLVAARRRDWFPIALLGAAGATAIPALVQGQQRDIHYLAMPLLLLLSAVAAGARPLLLGRSKSLVRLRGALLLIATATLWLFFQQGANLRSYFVQSPYGGSLATFRSQVASLTPEDSTICATLDLNTQQQAVFVAEMSGSNGFLVAPIRAAQAFLVSAGTPCPAQGPTSNITISLNARGNFVAAA